MPPGQVVRQPHPRRPLLPWGDRRLSDLPSGGSSATFGDAVLHVPKAKTLDYGRRCLLSEKRTEDLTLRRINGFCRHEI